MKRFRVLSDLHVDIQTPISIPNGKSDFVVLCGDVSGDPKKSAKWIKKNLGAGVCVSGNHLPYNFLDSPMDALRGKLAKTFGKRSEMTYLDAETKTCSKIVDGILFVGSCMYSDMKLPSTSNSNGDTTINENRAARRMNDYRWGIVSDVNEKTGETTYRQMTPKDCEKWFENAFRRIDDVLTKNEKSENPLPAVVVTHYPLVKDVVLNSFYVDEELAASYGSDMEKWLLSHPSVKCHCCGHCHDMAKEYRAFKIFREDGTRILVVNNSYGYAKNAHDYTFNVNRFVDVDSWEIEEIPETEETEKEKEARRRRSIAIEWPFV